MLATAIVVGETRQSARRRECVTHGRGEIRVEERRVVVACVEAIPDVRPTRRMDVRGDQRGFAAPGDPGQPARRSVRAAQRGECTRPLDRAVERRRHRLEPRHLDFTCHRVPCDGTRERRLRE
jgi:hypothetical protein